MELPPLKRLAVRLFAIQAFGRVEENTTAADAFAKFCRVDADDPYVSEAHSLSDLLRVRLREVAKLLDLEPESRPDVAELRSALQKLDSAIKGSSCEACKLQNGAQDVCRGRDPDRDARQVDEVGLCIQVIRDMYAYLRAAISDIILDWVLGDADAIDLAALELRLSTLWRGDPVTDRPTEPWQVEAATRFRDSEVAPRRLSDVQLKFQPAFFDWSSLLCVAWLLTHELVCHAFTGFDGSGGERKGCALDCPFYEGWMDEVAYLILAADLNFGIRATRRPQSAFLRDHRDDALRTADVFRGRRNGDIPGVARNVHAPQWRLGVQAARDTRDFLERSVSSTDESARRVCALRGLVRLSYRIQRHAPPTPVVRQIVNLLATLCAFGKRGVAGSAINPIALQVLLGDPIADISYWINELAALKQTWLATPLPGQSAFRGNY
jgi:hypothetical protein